MYWSRVIFVLLKSCYFHQPSAISYSKQRTFANQAISVYSISITWPSSNILSGGCISLFKHIGYILIVKYIAQYSDFQTSPHEKDSFSVYWALQLYNFKRSKNVIKTLWLFLKKLDLNLSNIYQIQNATWPLRTRTMIFASYLRPVDFYDILLSGR